jgi:hypothetical protein
MAFFFFCSPIEGALSPAFGRLSDRVEGILPDFSVHHTGEPAEPQAGIPIFFPAYNLGIRTKPIISRLSDSALAPWAELNSPPSDRCAGLGAQASQKREMSCRTTMMR